MGKLRQKAVYNNQEKGGQQVCFNIPSALFCFKKAFYIYSRFDCYNAFGLYGFRKTVRFQNHINRKNTGDDTCEFSIKAENEIGYDIQAVYFPAPFNSKKCNYSYHTDPMHSLLLCLRHCLYLINLEKNRKPQNLYACDGFHARKCCKHNG